ncbi:MAG TPA: cellulase family glycosylhydrolase [Candidatus Hydrogenedentes bacterium]|nr:cellulase family glycosylhydrolase [Candidatus Hydrogenedentota bacterium]
MSPFRWCFALVAILPCAVARPETMPGKATLPDGWPRPPIRAEGSVMVDATGRQVFLRGVNVGNKSSADRHVTWPDQTDYLTLRHHGMTAIRYLIFWSAVEPRPDEYDEAYLDAVAREIEAITETGLLVILDAHQDLYSEAIPGGNGAPAWAVAHPDLPHWTPGGVWSLAYFTSPRLHAAWDAFWNNAPGPDGTGLQERFAGAWRRVAARFRNMPGVIGYDLLNEPMPGASMGELGTVALATLGALAASETALSLPDLLAQAEHQGYLPPEVLGLLEDPGRFRTFMATLEPLIHRFEQDGLAGLYERVIPAIRQEDPDRLIFLEPTAAVNPGAESGLPLPRNGSPGTVAYLPHWYDLVLDTPIACEASRSRMEQAMAARTREAARLGLPLLIGEWGAFYNNASCVDAARMMAELLAAHTQGDFYWDLHRGLTRASYRDAIFRPSPIAVNGRVTVVSLNYDQGVFKVTWEAEQPDGPESLMYIPGDWEITTLSADGVPVDRDTLRIVEGFVTIPPGKGRAPRYLEARRKAP